MKTANYFPPNVKPTKEEFEEAIKGKIEITSSIGKYPVKLEAKNIEQFDLAKNNGYIIANKNQRVANAYRLWCELNNRPFVYAEHEGKSWVVIFDSRNIEIGLPVIALRPVIELSRMYSSIRIPIPDRFTFSPGYVQVMGISRKEVDEVAAKLYQITSLALPWEDLRNWEDEWGESDFEDIGYPSHTRDPEIVDAAKKVARGICQLCNKPAPFSDKNGEPYLEAHHINWLSRGGKDALENAVALCPNCHRKMHILDLAEDKENLKAKALRNARLR